MLSLISIVTLFISLKGITCTSRTPVQSGHVLWSKRLSENEIGEGNTIVFANDALYVSDNKCNIHMINLQGNVVGKINGNIDASCVSSLAFGLDSSIFAQAITYNDSQSSQVVTYNASTLDEINNTTVPGIVEGSPVISSDGLYTFLVSNVEKDDKDYVAEFRIIYNSNGSTLFTETSVNTTFAALGVGRLPVRGNYGNGTKGNLNSNDMLVWGEKFIADRGVEDSNGVAVFDGKVHFFQLPKDFNPAGGKQDLASYSGDNIGKVTLSAPLIPQHGMGAMFSFQAGQIRGWSKGHFFGRRPSLKSSMAKEFNNPIPSPNSGSFAFNDTIHIISSPSGDPYLYAYKLLENLTDPLESKTKQLWNISTSSAVSARVVFAFNDSLAYYADTEGNVVCIGTKSGEQMWNHSTGGNVRADVAILKDTYLAYGTSDGYATLLRIGDTKSESPSSNPSSYPSSVPTNVPSKLPTPSPSPGPSRKPTSFPIVESSNKPSRAPSGQPTSVPTDQGVPSQVPTSNPKKESSVAPSEAVVGGVDSASSSLTLYTKHLHLVAFVVWLLC